MSAPSPHVRVVAGLEDVARAGAEEFLASVTRGGPYGPCRVLLSGGRTPEPMYRLLASEPTRSRIDWNSVECYFGDERPVPPDHPDSNYGLLRRTLLEPLGLLAPRTYRIRGESSDLELAAVRYEALLRSRFAKYPPEDPSFDLVFLGLGAEGHTASLFPGLEIPETPPRLVVSAWIEAVHSMRATVTYRVLNAARRVVFLVSGEDKADAAQRTLAPDGSGRPTPASRVAPRHGEVIWILDRGAASSLPKAVERR
ncbi:MAG TPA: 6-phosphogluconolactonase [Candidatus Binatia bacterium]|nr:6-phosphogluconolactonase [Candidatus Binatia bacterium]